MQKLANKVAVVTASTEGIGFAIASRLCRDGARVVISSRKEENVKKALSELRSQHPEQQLHGLVCHVGKSDDRKNLIQETVKKFGKIDILVSNAAVNPHYGRISEIKEPMWDKLFEINIKAALFLTQDALPHMNKGSSIVFVSSVAAYVPLPGIAAYSVTKTALVGLMKALAQDLAPEDIRVNALAPGIIKTGFSKAIWSNESFSDTMMATIPMSRFGTPDECGGTVAFLCSDDASYITGETITVSGGIQSRL